MDQNSFEQICINYINETVQQFCIRKLIKDDLEWYALDGVHISDVNFLDNKPVLGKFHFFYRTSKTLPIPIIITDLFEQKPDGIWSILNDESKKTLSF